eukprot:6024572-Prorocentrum_lima.AAC.1
MVLDLACGIGGFTEAARALGMRVEAAVDVNPKILSTYKQLWGADHVRCADLCVASTLRDLQDAKAAFICLGFPCQPFSQAGNKQGIKDERSLLFQMIPELHAILRPWGRVLENVANFANLQNGEY